MKTRQFALLLALASAGCSTFSIRADRCPAYPAPSSPSVLSGADVKVQYLGTGGYLVRRGDDVVLFGPEYTNPGVAEVMFDHRIQTDRALVDRLLPEDADQAEAIVIGHSHYDHLLDTPYIANTHATKAKVFGSRTMAALIGSAVDPARLIDVNAAAVAGQPVTINERMRLWPIRSQHSDQFRMKIPFSGINQPFHMWRGEVAETQSALPATTSGWTEGEVYAYLLDFLDVTGTKVEFRVYYQDSGTDAPVGFPWGGNAPPDGKGVDVALICVGGDTEFLTQHPEGIIKATRPRFLLLGHWENFFMPQGNICRVNRVEGIPLQDTDEFIDRASAALSSARLPGKPILPCPTASVFHFPVDPANDAAVYKALKKGRVSYDCARIP